MRNYLVHYFRHNYTWKSVLIIIWAVMTTDERKKPNDVRSEECRPTTGSCLYIKRGIDVCGPSFLITGRLSKHHNVV